MHEKQPKKKKKSALQNICFRPFNVKDKAEHAASEQLTASSL